MALTNYSDLQQSVANFLVRDDLTTYIPDFIALAESRISSDLETNDLHITTTMTVDDASETLPANFKGMVRFNLEGVYPALDYMPPDSFHSTYAVNVSGRPIAYTIEGDSIFFAPYPATSLTATYTYSAKPSLATDTTNRLMTNAPDVYLYASLCEAARFLLDDDMLAKYEPAYREAMDRLNDVDQNKGALAMKLSGVV